jgi:SAM-dependent methyltransferase
MADKRVAAPYDRVADGYAGVRRADPRIAAAIERALGDARSVANVGAGTGNYEPVDREVVAIEPSAEMRARRPRGAAPCLDGTAEALPLEDDSVDAAMAVLTIHHWRDSAAGLAEMRRVARQRVVVLTFDVDVAEDYWFVADYLPETATADRERTPTIGETVALMGGAGVEAVPIPWDCTDGFLGAYWRRPEAYLDPDVRAGISTFQVVDAARSADALARLEEDLRSGAWDERHGDLRAQESLDLGYRLLVAG